jgi:hypothetical protein
MVCSKNPSRKAMGHPRGLKPRLFVMGALSRGLKASLPDVSTPRSQMRASRGPREGQGFHFRG